MVELVAVTVARVGTKTVMGSQMVMYAEIKEGMEEGMEEAEEDAEGVDVVEEGVVGDAVSVLPCYGVVMP